MGANKKSNFQKCGIILIDVKTIKSQDKSFKITCGFCKAEYNEMKIFSQHLEEKHSHDFVVELVETAVEPGNSTSLTMEPITIKAEDQPNTNDVTNDKLASSFTTREAYPIPLDPRPTNDAGNEVIDVPSIKREHGETFDEDEEFWDPQYSKRFQNSMTYSDEDMDTFQRSNEYANEKQYMLDDETSGTSKNVDEELRSRKISANNTQTSKGNMNYFSPSVNSICHGCAELSHKFDIHRDTSNKQYKNLVDIMAEHKILLERIATQTKVDTNMMSILPVNSEEKLKEFDCILATQADLYKQQIKSLLGGNAQRNLHQIFGFEIIMNYNLDGTFGKKRLRDFGNVFAVLIEVLSSFSESAEKTLRAAFQRQKKKYFKQTSRNKVKSQYLIKIESDSSDKEDKDNFVLH